MRGLLWDGGMLGKVEQRDVLQAGEVLESTAVWNVMNVK